MAIFRDNLRMDNDRIDAVQFQSAIRNLIDELFDGPTDDFAFILGRDDPGLLGTLSTISPDAASKPGANGGHSIVGHVHHVWFCLDVLNRWAAGDDNAFFEADWASSWNVKTVDETAWSALIEQVKSAGLRWRELVKQPRQWDSISLPGAVASVAHVAYHLAAIRQLAAFFAK